MTDRRLLEPPLGRLNAAERGECFLFWGHARTSLGITGSCFGRWYIAPFLVAGVCYLTVEHFVMAEKAALFGDRDTRAAILATLDPAAAKVLGRQVQGFDERVWIDHRYSIAVRANEAKFSQHRDLARFLVRTGSRVLAEASAVDRIWGIGLARDDERAMDPARWPGLNLLGFALMEIRARSASS